MAAISSAVMRVCMTAPTIGPSVVGPGFATLNARQEVACGLEPVPLRDIKFRFETYRLSEVPIPSRSAGPTQQGGSSARRTPSLACGERWGDEDAGAEHSVNSLNLKCLTSPTCSRRTSGWRKSP